MTLLLEQLACWLVARPDLLTQEDMKLFIEPFGAFSSDEFQLILDRVNP